MILVSMATDLESHRAQLEQSADMRARLAT
jgi:hypothetical protein